MTITTAKTNKTMRSKKNNIVSVPIPAYKNLESGQIVKWNFQIGDVIKDFDIICEIKYPFFNIEVMSEYDGKLISINENKIFSPTEKSLCKIEQC